MKKYKVYLLRDKNRNIVYCGLTGRTLQERFDAHVAQKTLQRSHFTIELVVDGLTITEAASLERKLIEQYDLLNVGFNKSPGSINGFSNSHSDEQKKKWSKERKGKPVSPEHAEKNRKARLGKKNSANWHKRQFESHAKPVICLDTGVVYPSGRHAAKALNLNYSKISLVCNGFRTTTGGKRFAFFKNVRDEQK
jgi:hypothetical protein